jgi:hypothetical protein
MEVNPITFWFIGISFCIIGLLIINTLDTE